METKTTRCDARCWYAINPRCRCSCHGKNHQLAKVTLHEDPRDPQLKDDPPQHPQATYTGQTIPTPIGDLPILKDGDLVLVETGHTRCRRCHMPISHTIGIGWTYVFVAHCYLYCCCCCPQRSSSPCPKEKREQQVTDQLAHIHAKEQKGH